MYCPNCGAQNADTNKFCLKCGTALPQAPAGSPASPPPYSPPRPPRNPLAYAVITGGLAGLIGGAVSVIGWLMPWTSALVSVSGLQLTLSAFDMTFTGLGTLRYTDHGWILVCLSIFVFLVFGSILLLGVLSARTGLSLFEGQSSSSGGRYQIQAEVDQLRSRSIKGIVLMVSIFLAPRILGALLSLQAPGIGILGQLGNLLPNSGYGEGFFLSAGGFVLAYVGARLARART